MNPGHICNESSSSFDAKPLGRDAMSRGEIFAEADMSRMDHLLLLTMKKKRALKLLKYVYFYFILFFFSGKIIIRSLNSPSNDPWLKVHLL